VLAVEGGRVTAVEVATSPDVVPYWNTTYRVAIRTREGRVWVFGELADAAVVAGAPVGAGALIGHVGAVLNPGAVTVSAPGYIRELVRAGHASMLHVELHRCPVPETDRYLGGNWFGDRQPDFMLDPTADLTEAAASTPR